MNITLGDGRTELWQWDTGRKIVVDDKSVSEVHYSKYSSTQAITREVIDGKAEIPNFLLQDTHAVTVYAYSGSIENGYTMAEKTFNVVKKPKPANYVETEEDKAILAKLKEEIGDLSELQTEAKIILFRPLMKLMIRCLTLHMVRTLSKRLPSLKLLCLLSRTALFIRLPPERFMQFEEVIT